MQTVDYSNTGMNDIEKRGYGHTSNFHVEKARADPEYKTNWLRVVLSLWLLGRTALPTSRATAPKINVYEGGQLRTSFIPANAVDLTTKLTIWK